MHILSNINSEFYGLANAYGQSGWKAGYTTLAFGKLGWNVQVLETFGFAKHFDEPTRFSYDLLNDGPHQITAKNLRTHSSLNDNDEDQDVNLTSTINLTSTMNFTTTINFFKIRFLRKYIYF